MNFDVVTVGSAFVDVYLASPDFKKVGKTLCEVYGGKVVIKQMVMTTGGGATNTAVGLERLGLQTACVCCVGQDDWGLFVRKELHREGVSPLYIQQVTEATSYSTILVTEDGGRTALVFRGASNHLSWSKVEWEKLDPAWFYVSSLGGDFNLLTKIVRQAEKEGIKIALNPGSKEIEAGSKLKAFLPKIEALILNQQEAEKLGSVANLIKSGPKIVAVTAGRNGAMVWAGKKKFAGKALPAKVVEETGAGDAFGCGLVAGLVKGWDLNKALKLGLANGAAVTEHFGPKQGLLFEPEIGKWLK